MDEQHASAGAPTGAVAQPTDMGSKRFLKNLDKNRLIRQLREVGVLKQDDEIVAAAPLFKLPQAISLLFLVGLLPGIIAGVAIQRTCYLIVTRRHVILTGFFLSSPKKIADKVVRMERPVPMALAKEPKASHFMGNKVTLPPQMAALLGRPTVEAGNGNLVDYALRVARTAA